MPELGQSAQAILGIQQDRALLAEQMASDPRTAHLTLIDNEGGGDCLILAVLQSLHPTAPAYTLSAMAPEYRQILLHSHPEHFTFRNEADGQLHVDPNAYLDITRPGLLDALLVAVFGANRPQVNVINPQARGGLLMYTVGHGNPELDSITLTDLAGHYMAAVPSQALEAGMHPRFTELPAPSGVPVDNQPLSDPLGGALSSIAAQLGVAYHATVEQEILAAVPRGNLNKKEHYEAILAANRQRTPEQRWPNRSMEKAAGITST